MKIDEQTRTLYRAGLNTMGDMMRAWLAGAECIRACQLNIIRMAMSGNPESLLAMQAKLVRAQTVKLLEYWIGLAELGPRDGPAENVIAEIRVRFRQPLEAVPHASDPVVAPLNLAANAAGSPVGSRGPKRSNPTTVRALAYRTEEAIRGTPST